jgi:hypothetical protein
MLVCSLDVSIGDMVVSVERGKELTMLVDRSELVLGVGVTKARELDTGLGVGVTVVREVELETVEETNVTDDEVAEVVWTSSSEGKRKSQESARDPTGGSWQLPVVSQALPPKKTNLWFNASYTEDASFLARGKFEALSTP